MWGRHVWDDLFMEGVTIGCGKGIVFLTSPLNVKNHAGQARRAGKPLDVAVGIKTYRFKHARTNISDLSSEAPKLPIAYVLDGELK
jgi:hypothetical protein